MSIESAKARMSQINAQIKEIQNRPKALFQSILQEKLGITTEQSSVSQSVSTDLTDSTALSDAYKLYLSSASSLDSSSASVSDATMLEGYSNTYALEKAAPYMDIIQNVSEKYGMPENLIIGIIQAESDFDNNSVSYAGAQGLMQLMPETAAEVGVTDAFDPAQNIDGAVHYITKLLDKYNGDVKLSLAAYNTGPGKIDRRGVTSSNSAEYLTVPQSIRDYVDRVLKYAGYTA